MKYDCGFGVMHYVDWILRHRAACVNIAGSGATMAGMMKLPARRELDAKLRQGFRNKPWDALLFSGGGNDFAGDRFAEWLLPYNGQTNPQDAIAQPRFTAMMNELRTLYGQLASLVHNLSPTTLLFINGYDFPIADGRHVRVAGPWLKPGFDTRGYPLDVAFRSAVVAILLRQFAAMLQSVCTVFSFVRLVPTQGVLTTREWANELHPTNPGFEKIAKVFVSQLESELG